MPSSSLAATMRALVGRSIRTTVLIDPANAKRLDNIVPGWASTSARDSSPCAATSLRRLRSTAHWTYHTDADLLNLDLPSADVGPDGNPELLPTYRRMWAGGRFDLHAAISVGDTIVKEQRIVSVTEKVSKTYGPVFFLKRRCTLSRVVGVGGGAGLRGDRGRRSSRRGDAGGGGGGGGDGGDGGAGGGGDVGRGTTDTTLTSLHEHSTSSDGERLQLELCLEEELDHVYMVNTRVQPAAH